MFEGAIRCFGILARDAMAAADADKRLKNGIVTRAVAGEQLAGGLAIELRDSEKNVFGGNVFVLEFASFIKRAAQHIVRRRAQILLSGARDFRQAIDFAADLRAERIGLSSELGQQRRDDAIALGEQRRKQMHRFDLLLAGGGCELLRGLQRLLGLDCQFIHTQHVTCSRSQF